MAFLGARLKPAPGVRKEQSRWRNKRSPSRGQPPPGPCPVWGTTTRSHASEGVAPTEARKGPAGAEPRSPEQQGRENPPR